MLFAPLWCLCQKLSLSLLYFNKALLHKSTERSRLVTGPRLIPLLERTRIPASFMAQQQLFTYTLSYFKCSPSMHIAIQRLPALNTLWSHTLIYSSLLKQTGAVTELPQVLPARLLSNMMWTLSSLGCNAGCLGAPRPCSPLGDSRKVSCDEGFPSDAPCQSATKTKLVCAMTISRTRPLPWSASKPWTHQLC